jgi:opacity protein-like surface antigen
MKKLMLAAALVAALSPAAAFAQSGGGDFTIDVRTAGEQVSGTGNNATANRNTDAAAIERTIAANPGLAEKLAEEGVETSEIGALSVEPDGKVVVYKK